MLTPDAEFVLDGNHLMKTVRIETDGTKTGTVTGSKTWQVNVSSGVYYSFWSMTYGETWTYGAPTAAEDATWGRIKAMFQ
jgi:hypothetical protein